MKITEDIIYAGVNDHQVDLFEGQYRVPNGMAYNSYVILDEKTAVMAGKCCESTGWQKTGLSDRAAYGAGSLCEY